jgi:hypothetical protein
LEAQADPRQRPSKDREVVPREPRVVPVRHGEDLRILPGQAQICRARTLLAAGARIAVYLCLNHLLQLGSYAETPVEQAFRGVVQDPQLLLRE